MFRLSDFDFPRTKTDRKQKREEIENRRMCQSDRENRREEEKGRAEMCTTPTSSATMLERGRRKRTDVFFFFSSNLSPTPSPWPCLLAPWWMTVCGMESGAISFAALQAHLPFALCNMTAWGRAWLMRGHSRGRAGTHQGGLSCRSSFFPSLPPFFPRLPRWRGVALDWASPEGKGGS